MLRLPSWTALATIAGVPLFWSFQLTLESYNRPKLAFLLAGTSALLGLALILARGRTWFGLARRMAIPITAILVPLIVSWLASPYKEWALLGRYGRLQGLLPYLLVIIFGLLALGAVGREPKKIAWALAIAGGTSGLYSLVQAAGLDPFVYNTVIRHSSGLWTAQSTLGNPNFAGAFFAMVIPITLALAISDRRHRPAASLLMGLSAIGLVASFSEGPWAAALGGLAVLAGYWLRPRWRHALVAGFLVAGTVAVVFVGTVVAAGARADDPAGKVDSHLARYWYWQSAISMAADYPVFGRGPNSYAVESPRYSDPQAVERLWEVADDPHSVPLAFLTSAGVPGLVGYLTFIAWGLIQGIRATRRDETLFAAGLLGALVSYLLVSLISFDEITLRVTVWAVLVAFVGLNYASHDPGPPPPLSPWRRRTPAIAAASLVVIGGWWIAAGLLHADHQMRRGESLAVDNDAVGAVTAFRSGLGFWDEYHYRELAGRRIGELGIRRGPEGPFSSRTAGREEVAERYIAEMRRMFEYLGGFPDARGMISEARLLHVWADRTGLVAADEEALALYERALSIDSYNPVLAAETAQVLAALDRRTEAISLLESFVPYEPPFGRFWAVLALQYEAAGRHPEAVAAVENGLAHEPRSPAILEAAEIIGIPIPH